MKREWWTRRRKIIAVVGGSCIGAALIVTCVFLWACGGLQSAGDVEGPILEFGDANAEQVEAGDKLVVLTWNIAYAYGAGSADEGYEPRTAEAMAGRLTRIGEAIRDSGADVVLLQEIDFDSARSHHVDQLAELGRITGLRYGARGVSWRAGYVPFPFWPPSKHYGAIESGAAVLSRYPIDVNRVTLHPKPACNSSIYNAFYLFRHSQYVRVLWGERTVALLNNHLEAYDGVSRREQAGAMCRIAAELRGEHTLTIVGGDLNSIPPEATLQKGFPDEPDCDLTGGETVALFRKTAGFVDTVTVEDYVKDEKAYLTFPARAPNRRLDFLFVAGDVAAEDARVLQVGALSDHLPLRSVLVVQ